MNAQDLKNSILQLAIQGKLVEHREEEGFAKELLEKIEAKKKQLIQEGKIKKQKILPVIKDDEIPFDIPKTWEWARMGNVIDFINGRAYKKEELKDEGKYKVLRVGNFFTNNSWYYSDMELEDSKYCNNGDLLYAWSASFGPKIWDGDKTIFHYHIWKIDFDSQIFYRDYLYWFLLQDVTIIKKSTTGSTMVHVSMENMRPRLIPIPPFVEQKRIVAKIEELMSYVEKYDKAYSEVEELNKKFPEDMLKSILQYAIKGKLVEQREDEGTAEELYQQIQEEKEKLVKEGKIKKQKKLPEIAEDEIPFDIPENWRWVRLADVSENIHYGYTASANEVGNCKLLRITDIQNNSVDWDSVPYCDVKDKDYVTYGLNNRDIMIARTGGTIGKTYIVESLNDRAVFASYLIRVVPVNNINEKYLKKFMESPLYWHQLKEGSMGTGQPNVNGTTLSKLVLPLPPLAEQDRIVEKIEELLPYTNQLVK
jgi:type I restriction enzyme, S subunit